MSTSSSSMGVADELLDKLFHLIDQQERYADDIMALATELKDMRQVITIGQCVGNSAGVLGSATLIATGIATLLTGGLAAPVLIIAAGVTAGTGAVTSLTLFLFEKWKSSEKMKNAEATFKQIEKLWKNIEMLQKKLSEECESQVLNGLDPVMSFSIEVQFEITARLLEALARRSGRDLPISHLRNLMRTSGMHTHRCEVLNPNIFFKNISCLLTFLGFSYIFLSTTKRGTKFYTPFLVKTALKGMGQVAGGLIGLALTLPDLVKNCEELIKKEHETEASEYLKKKANEIRENVEKLRRKLDELQ
ncbi:hypothetical protein C0J45_7570 [Silurus meridionalis]|nr:hypothetical protein C0J45_7570 [Silurus meridionalis]